MNDLNQQMKKEFTAEFHHEPAFLISSPGRTELGGNHTDHQHGRILAAAVGLDSKAAVAKNGTGTIRLVSEGFSPCEISLSEPGIREKEKGTTAALIRGVAAGFAERGAEISGFDAYVRSTVIPGGGLSSSASFEILMAAVMNVLFCDSRFSKLDLALIGQFAEREYYGKPSGLMDQLVCSWGGCVTVDFEDNEHPVIQEVEVDFDQSGYTLCIVDSNVGHENLTGEYASITQELAQVCSCFGKHYLREIPEEEFYENLRNVTEHAGCRAVLRAIHVYNENKRVLGEVDALNRGDFEAYLALVKASGESSWQYLQNVIPCGSTVHQEMALTLAVVSHALQGRGACRVQGGGFAGAVQAYVPVEMLDSFRAELERNLGSGRCTVLSVRKEGGCVLETY